MPGDQDTGREGFLEEGHEGQGSPEKAAWLRAWPRRHLGSGAAAEMVLWAERRSSETCWGPDPQDLWERVFPVKVSEASEVEEPLGSPGCRCRRRDADTHGGGQRLGRCAPGPGSQQPREVEDEAPRTPPGSGRGDRRRARCGEHSDRPPYTPHPPRPPHPGSALLTPWTTAPPNRPLPGAASGVCCDLAVLLCVRASQTPARSGPSSPIPKAPNHRICPQRPSPPTVKMVAVGAGGGFKQGPHTALLRPHQGQHRREGPWPRLPRDSGAAGTGGRLLLLHFLVWALVTQVYSACRNLPGHICQRYTFL